MNEKAHKRLYPPDATPEVVKTHPDGSPERVRWSSSAHPTVEVYHMTGGEMAWEAQIDEQGKYHGIFREWSGAEWLSFVTSYHHGIPDGIALQFDKKGRVHGSYFLARGTGVDLWSGSEDATLSEEWHMKDGATHGLERWWDEDKALIERTYKEGVSHGIHREWTIEGELEPGFPRFFIQGDEVSSEQYATLRQGHDDLPDYVPQDDVPQRPFPWYPQPVPTLTKAQVWPDEEE